MNIQTVDQHTKTLVDSGHRVFQVHRFARGEYSHVARLERWAEFPTNAKIIDMGSGTGEVARIMADIRKDLSFCLVNISQVQLDYSPQSMRQHCGDFCNVPESDASFDAAMYCFSIGHEDVDNALHEAVRLLVSGGVLFIYDMVRISGNNTSMAAAEYVVNSRDAMESAAENAGFALDWYMEPHDDGVYGKSVLGDGYATVDTVFGGTIPAIWRFIKR